MTPEDEIDLKQGVVSGRMQLIPKGGESNVLSS